MSKSTHGGKRPGAGAKTKAQKGQRKKEKLQIYLTAEIYDQLMAGYNGSTTLGEYVESLLSSAIKNS